MFVNRVLKTLWEQVPVVKFVHLFILLGGCDLLETSFHFIMNWSKYTRSSPQQVIKYNDHNHFILSNFKFKFWLHLLSFRLFKKVSTFLFVCLNKKVTATSESIVWLHSKLVPDPNINYFSKQRLVASLPPLANQLLPLIITIFGWILKS